MSGMVTERRGRYKNIHTRYNIIGASLCIVALVQLFLSVIFDENNVLLLVAMLSAGFVIAGCGVNLFTRTGIIWGSYEKLLQEGDYTKSKKKNKSYY